VVTLTHFTKHRKKGTKGYTKNIYEKRLDGADESKRTVLLTVLSFHTYVVIIGLCYTFSHQYTTVASFIFWSHTTNMNSAQFWHICLCWHVNISIQTYIYIHKHRQTESLDKRLDGAAESKNTVLLTVLSFHTYPTSPQPTVFLMLLTVSVSNSSFTYTMHQKFRQALVLKVWF